MEGWKILLGQGNKYNYCSGSTIRRMVMGCSNGLTVAATKVNTVTTVSMARELSPGRMAESTRANGNRERSMGRAYSASKIKS